MIVYFADRKFNILGQASTGLPSGLAISSDTKIGDVESGISVFECKIEFDNTTRAKVEKCTEVGNFVLRKNDGEEDELYTIIDAEINTKKQTVYIYAEDAGLDLLNEIVGEYEADKEYGIDHYVKMVIQDSGFVIGINEASGLKRKLTFDKEQNVTARLASIAAAFDNCEVSYSFEIKGLRCVGKTINIYRKRGKDIGETLRLNKEIDNIVITKTIANMATALRAEGSTPEGADDPITLNGHAYDDGDFYVDGDMLKSRKALEKWCRYINPDEPNMPAEKDGHIVRLFSYDTTEKAVLCAETIRELQKICDKEVNYEADILFLPRNVKVGDRVNIVDEKGQLYLSSRLLQLERSVVSGEYKAVLGEHLLKKSGISDKVIELSRKYAQNTTVISTVVKVANDSKQAALDARLRAEDANEKADEAYEKSYDAYVQASKSVRNAEIFGQYSQLVTVENALENSIENIKLYGKTTQSATPTPTAPVAVSSVGDGGSVSLAMDGQAVSTFSVQNGFPGIPMQNACTKHNYTDANGQKWFTDEIDFARGVYIQRFFTLTFDGTEVWKTSSSGTPQIGSAQIPGLEKFDTGTAAPDNGNCCYHRCSHFLSVPRNGSRPDGSLNSYGGTNGRTLQFRFDAYTGNIDGWKAWLASQAAAGTPVTVLLGRNTPVETPLAEMVSIPNNQAGQFTLSSECNIAVDLSAIASGSAVRNAQAAAVEALVTAKDAKYYADNAVDRANQAYDEVSNLEPTPGPAGYSVFYTTASLHSVIGQSKTMNQDNIITNGRLVQEGDFVVDVSGMWGSVTAVGASTDGSNFVLVKSTMNLIGPTGKTAYQYAKDGGYTGTEAEFSAKLASDIPISDGNLELQPASGEGGQILLHASKADRTNNGIAIDTANGDFRIFGLESADGTSRPGYGSVFGIDPYDKTITGGYTFDGVAASANKLNIDAGSEEQPVYFKNGVPVPTTITNGQNGFSMFYASVNLGAVGSVTIVSEENVSTYGRYIQKGDMILGKNGIVGAVTGFHVTMGSTSQSLVVESLVNLNGSLSLM